MQSGCCWNTTRRRSGSTTSIGARRSSAAFRSARSGSYTRCGQERQFTQAEICEFLIEPKQTVHSALKKLEAEGYLARTSSADLRSKHVALTEKGEQFARTWIDRVPEAETAALGAMPEEECAAFVRGLHLFCRLLEEGFRENGAI